MTWLNRYYKCVKCGYQMTDEEVWVSTNIKDARVFCYSHAPKSAIRLKDTMVGVNKGG